MINISTLTTALAAALSNSAALTTLGCTVERSTRINFDPARTPWIGVYPGTVNTAPKTIGGHSWVDHVSLQVVAQTASFSNDGTAASDLLESLAAAISDVVNSDLTFGISTARVMSFEREYRYVVFDDSGSGDLFMPQVIIKLQLEVRT